MTNCEKCHFFQSSGFGMIGGVCKLSGDFKLKTDSCEPPAIKIKEVTP